MFKKTHLVLLRSFIAKTTPHSEQGVVNEGDDNYELKTFNNIHS